MERPQHLATFSPHARNTFVCTSPFGRLDGPSRRKKLLPASILSPFASWHSLPKSTVAAGEGAYRGGQGFATCAGRHFCMHGNYVSRNFICVNAMQQKAAASEHNTNTQKDGKMSRKLGWTEACPSKKRNSNKS